MKKSILSLVFIIFTFASLFGQDCLENETQEYAGNELELNKVELDSILAASVSQGEFDEVELDEFAVDSVKKYLNNKQNYSKEKGDYQKQDIVETDFDKEKWKKLTEELDFKDPKEKKEKDISNLPNLPTFGFGAWFTYLLYLLIFGLIIFVIAYLFSNHFAKSNPKTMEQISEELDKKDIKDLHFESLLQTAKSQSDYRLLVRIYYLMLIKELNALKWIKWKKDKTNRKYIQEMQKQEAYAATFEELTLVFERIWYGDISLKKADYRAVEKEFIDFIAKIESLSTNSND